MKGALYEMEAKQCAQSNAGPSESLSKLRQGWSSSQRRWQSRVPCSEGSC